MTYPTLQQIAHLTAERFPQYPVDTLGLEPLEKGGSDRKFYRVRAPGVEPLIFVQDGQLREENRHYVEIGAFLAEAGVRVPAMHLHEEAEGRIWMEDLGDTDLWACRNQPWAERRGTHVPQSTPRVECLRVFKGHTMPVNDVAFTSLTISVRAFADLIQPEPWLAVGGQTRTTAGLYIASATAALYIASGRATSGPGLALLRRAEQPALYPRLVLGRHDHPRVGHDHRRLPVQV